jgi:hypothetical protein
MAGVFILWHQLGDVFLPWSTEIICDWDALSPEQEKMWLRQLILSQGFGIAHALGENEFSLIVDL